MKKIYIMVLVLFTYVNAYAQWTAVNTTDDFTDKKIAYIVYETKDIIVKIDERDLFWITIKRKSLGRISPETNVEIRVDKHEMYKAEVGFWNSLYNRNGTEISKRNVYLNNNTISFNFLNAFIADDSDFFCKISKGKFLRLRYSLDEYKESLKIPLKGITKKIKIVFGNKILSECK